MEQSSVVDATLRIYRQLREAGHDRVGTVLQSYLYRTESDLESLLPLAPNLRFVKGAYLEPPEIAYTVEDGRRRRLCAARRGVAAGRRLHGDRDARRGPDRPLPRVRRAGGDPRDRFELQMLYGVRPALQLDSCAAGTRCSSRRPTGLSGIRTSCAARRAAGEPRLLRRTSCDADPGKVSDWSRTSAEPSGSPSRRRRAYSTSNSS